MCTVCHLVQIANVQAVVCHLRSKEHLLDSGAFPWSSLGVHALHFSSRAEVSILIHISSSRFQTFHPVSVDRVPLFTRSTKTKFKSKKCACKIAQVLCKEHILINNCRGVSHKIKIGLSVQFKVVAVLIFAFLFNIVGAVLLLIYNATSNIDKLAVQNSGVSSLNMQLTDSITQINHH